MNTENVIIEFSKVFDNIMKSTGMTIYSLASATEIDYSMISKVKKGTRNLSVNYFKKLLKKWPGLTPSNKESLSNAYIASNFGKSHFKEFIELLRFRKDIDVIETQEAFKVSINPKETVITITSENILLNIIQSIIDNELTKTRGALSGRIFTNIPLEKIIPLLSSYTRTNSDVKLIDYKHMIELETGKAPTPSTIANVMKLMTYGYPVSYIKTPENRTNQNIALFPYYVISTDSVVNISKDFSFGCFEKNKVMADVWSVQFQKTFDEATPYIHTVGDILQLKGLILSSNKGIFDEHYVYGAFSSYVFHIDEEIMSNIAKPDVPNREYLIKSTTAYYNSYYNLISEHVSFTPKEELARFIDTGHVNMLPDEYSFNFTLEDRVKLLQSMLKAMESGKEKLFILKENVCIDSENNSVEMFYSQQPGNTSLSFHSRIEAAPMHFIGNSSMFIKNIETIEDFHGFFEYLQLSTYCYDEEESLMIFKDELTRCLFKLERKNKDELTTKQDK